MPCNALSVDLEEYFQVSNFEGVIERRTWDSLPSRVANATRLLLDLFEEHGARATFFVLGWLAERHAALLREIVSRGHEIACHGYAHDRVDDLGRVRFREDVSRARKAIEDAAGVRASGYRAPSFSITRRSLWALHILAEEGYAYDSSIFPVRHPRYGIPGFEPRPLRLELGGGLSIQEFPLTTLRMGPLTLPVAGGAYLRLFPASLFRWAFDRAARDRGPTVLYLHPWEVDPEQPRQRVGWRVRVNHYHNLRHVEGRLRRLLQRIRFAPMGEVLASLRAAGELPARSLAEAVPGRP